MSKKSDAAVRRTQGEAVLQALRQTKGGPAEAAELVAAMYPLGGGSIHALYAAVAGLRKVGHDIRGTAKTGYQLTGVVEVTATPRKQRRCLGGCGKMFLSDGPGHRICLPCSQRRPSSSEAFMEYSVARR